MAESLPLEQAVFEACERLLAVIFERRRFDPRIPLCYSYIVILGEDREEKVLGLVEAIEIVLATLPFTRGKKDPQEWGRRAETLRLLFGLKDGKPRTLLEVRQELGGISRSRVGQVEAKAIQTLRHPSRSRLLEQFLVPSPEDRARESRDFGRLEEDWRRTRKKPSPIGETESGVERDIEAFSIYDPVVKAAFRTVADGWQRTHSGHASSLPTFTWGALWRNGITTVAQMREFVANWRPKQFHLIGPIAVRFIRQVLQELDAQEASS